MAGAELISRLDAVRRRFTELITYVAIVVGLLGLLGWIGYDWRRGHAGAVRAGPLHPAPAGPIWRSARDGGPERAGGGARHRGPDRLVALAQSVLAMLITLTRYYN